MDGNAALLGRDAELAELRAAWAEARAGRGGLRLIEGEPGMGKSTLAAHLAHESGAETLLLARAWPMDRALPWSVVTASIGAHLRTANDALRARLTAGLADLARLFPDLEIGRPEPLGDPGLEKARLLGALTAVLSRMRPPVLAIVEDAHHADDASLEWLHHAARAAAHAPVLLLATYRPAVGRRALDALVRSAPRPPLRLGPLDGASTTALIGRALAHAPDAVRRSIATRSGGVPLFVDALSAHAAERGADALEDDPLPDSLRALFDEWLAELAPADRAILEALACASGPAEPRALAAVAGVDETALRGPLAALTAAGWIASTDEPARVRYDLAHPLAREAVVDDVEAARACAIHARWAGWLEDAGATELALAEHYRRAKDAVDDARAIEVLRRAGLRALEQLAAREAARHLEAALARTTGDDARRPELHEALGRALQLSGRLVEAERAYLAAAEDGADPDRIARVRRAACMVAWETGAPDRARRHVEDGLAAVGDHRPARVELLRALLVTMDRSLDHHAVAEITERLAREAAGLGSAAADTEVAMHRSILAFYRGDEPEALRHLAEMRSLARGLDVLSMLRVLRVEHASHRALGDANEALRAAERTLAFAAEHDAPGLADEGGYQRASAFAIAGRYDEAEAFLTSAESALVHGDKHRAHVAVRAIRAIVAALRGATESAEAALEALGDFGEADARGAWFMAYARARVAFAEGRWADAARIEDAVIVDGDFIVAPMPTHALAVAAEARLALGDVEHAREIEDRLARRDRYARLWAAQLGAMRALSAERPADAVGPARRAVEGFDALGTAHDAARARLVWAAALHGVGDGEAANVAHDAHDALLSIGAAADARRARELLRTLGERPSTRRRAATDAPLSERELEVARLVARGRTNKEVAAALFISTSTVSTHLKRIYKRLGLSGRAALATWLAERE